MKPSNYETPPHQRQPDKEFSVQQTPPSRDRQAGGAFAALALTLLLLGLSACGNRQDPEPEMDLEPVAVMMSLAADGRVVWAGEDLTQEQLQARFGGQRRSVGTVIVFTDDGVSRNHRDSLERVLDGAGFGEVVFRDRP